MPVKLLVTRLIGAGEPKAFTFDQEQITIGRDSSNILVLPDEKRVVGRKHAEILCSEHTYQLIDLGSRNFTYLKGERLVSGQPYPLQEGDTFKIGDFDIVFTVIIPTVQVKQELERGEKTIFLNNPFALQAAELVKVLCGIGNTYDRTPGRREEAFQEALQEALREHEPHDIMPLIATVLSPQTGATSATAKAPKQRETPPPSEGRNRKPVPSVSEGPELRQGVAGRHQQILDTLLQFVAALVGVPSQFRLKFIGETIMQSVASSFLYSNDFKVLKNHLFDPEISEEELGHRLGIIEKATRELALHQVALLDGYKASILTGVQRFLDEVDPDILQQRLAQDKPLFRILPFLGKLQVVRQLEQTCRELRLEDWAAEEHRIFRPAFIKAYRNRMTSLQRHESETDKT